MAASFHDLGVGLLALRETQRRARYVHELLGALEALLQRREVHAIRSLRHYRGGRPGSSPVVLALIGCLTAR